MSNPTELPDLSRRTHELKTDPVVFAAVMAGAKTHEIRLNDRGFQTGDDLLLRETTYTGEQMSRGYPLHYTGRTTARVVSHIQTGYGLADDWCILSFARRAQPEGEAPQADPPRMSTDESREYLIKFMEKHFTDRTYHRYIRGERGSVNLAGDFAWQMARALRMLERAPAATLSPLCGAQHAESGAPVELPKPVAYRFPKSGEGNGYYFDESLLGEEERFKHLWEPVFTESQLREALAAQQAAAPAPELEAAFDALESYGENGDYVLASDVYDAFVKGSAPSAPGTPEAPKQPAHGHRDDYYLLANGRRLGLESISRVRNMPNWVLAMELFATGSGSAYQICRDAGVDPESTTIQRAAQLNGGQEGSESNG